MTIEKEDIEAIAQRVAEILRLKPSTNALRQKRYRERKRNALRNAENSSDSNVTRYGSTRENAVTERNALRNAFLSRARNNDLSKDKYKEEEKGVLGENRLEDRNANAHNHDKENRTENQASFELHAGQAGSNGKGRSGPLMTNAKLKELADNPAYEGINLTKEAFKFNQWCEVNSKTRTVRRFVNWLNRMT